MVCIGVYAWVLPTIAMDPPNCFKDSTSRRYKLGPCYYVRANGTLVNAGAILVTPVVASGRPFWANFELFVMLSKGSSVPTGVGIYTQGGSLYTVNLPSKITVETGFYADSNFQLGGKKTSDGFRLDFPVFIKATVKVPYIGTLVLPLVKQNGFAIVSDKGEPHHLIARAITTGSDGGLTASISMNFEIGSVNLLHWRYSSFMNINISGRKDGFSFTYVKKVPLISKSL